MQVFSCKFCEISKNNFFLQNTSRWLLLDFFIHLTKLFFAIQWTNRNQVLYIFEHVLSWLLNVMNIMSFGSGKLYFAKQIPHRSSHLHIFSKIGVLKNVTNFTQKHLCWSCFLIKLQDKFNTHVFLWNLQNHFLQNTLVAASWPSCCCIGRHISLRHNMTPCGMEQCFLGWLTD